MAKNSYTQRKLLYFVNSIYFLVARASSEGTALIHRQYSSILYHLRIFQQLTHQNLD